VQQKLLKVLLLSLNGFYETSYHPRRKTTHLASRRPILHWRVICWSFQGGLIAEKSLVRVIVQCGGRGGTGALLLEVEGYLRLLQASSPRHFLFGVDESSAVGWLQQTSRFRVCPIIRCSVKSYPGNTRGFGDLPPCQTFSGMTCLPFCGLGSHRRWVVVIWCMGGHKRSE